VKKREKKEKRRVKGMLRSPIAGVDAERFHGQGRRERKECCQILSAFVANGETIFWKNEGGRKGGRREENAS